MSWSSATIANVVVALAYVSDLVGDEQASEATLRPGGLRRTAP